MNNTFKDLHGNKWTVEVNMATVKRIKDSLDCNIADLNNKETMTKLADDIVFLVDVIYLCLKPQLDEKGISDVEFGQSLDGETVNQASEAFMEAFIAFFPARTRRRLETARSLGIALNNQFQNQLDLELTGTGQDLNGQDSSASSHGALPFVN